MGSAARVHIRSEEAGDEDAIRRVLVEAFPTPDESRLVDALRAAGRLWLSLVAEAEPGGTVIGQVAFSPVTIEGAAAVRALGLAPVAVALSQRRHGVAAALVRSGLEECRRLGVEAVCVLGDPAYYARFGFAPAARFGLVDEYGGGEAFQALELTVGALGGSAGGLRAVRYAPEFEGLG